MFVRLATFVACAACTAEHQWSGYVADDSWLTPPGIPLSLRVSKPDQHTITAVALPASAAESPSGPAVAGTRLSVTLDGVACEVSVLGRSTMTVERSRSTAEEVRRPNTPAGTRELRGLDVLVRCGDQPVPGTDASLRGARSRHALPWAALIFALAIATGELARRRRLSIAITLGAIVFAGSVVLGFVLFDGLYKVNYMMLFVALGVIGIVAMRGDTPALRIAVIVGAAIGCVIAPLIWPLWNGFGPIMALIFVVLCAAIGAAGVTLKQG